ncbi:hypothetical protein GBAR_LOCUS31036 [Geodia barretti]|uniref:CARD domain-containing protein n=1 Tax=Geodia barretti TaxID=519541 RepID=A0AA35XGU8_GEOBA|nr:hypothetical protein GBAR_LOCUS31036 [Geodia barretti]
MCNELDVDRITPVLRAEHMLTADEFEQLTNPHFTTQTRRQKLLLFIPRKGRAHFEKLGECLVWSGQSELARKIGVPVEDIRPSPHPRACPAVIDVTAGSRVCENDAHVVRWNGVTCVTL